MAISSKISPELVRQLIDYNPETGVALWRARTEQHFSNKNRCAARMAGAWNARYAGKPAFTVFAARAHTSRCSIFKVSYPASHIAWLHVHGKAPDYVIDHINGDRSDNRMANLRDVPLAVNARNCKLRIDNTSGLAGIHQNKKTKQWHARVNYSGHVITLGSYRELEHARIARQTAMILLGFTERHGVDVPFLAATD